MSFGPTSGKPTATTGNGLGPRTQIINIDKTNITRAELTTMIQALKTEGHTVCLLYTSPSPRDRTRSRMPSSA